MTKLRIEHTTNITLQTVNITKEIKNINNLQLIKNLQSSPTRTTAV